LACLRWLVLNRSGGVPKDPNTIERVKGLIINNPSFKKLISQREGDFPHPFI